MKKWVIYGLVIVALLLLLCCCLKQLKFKLKSNSNTRNSSFIDYEATTTNPMDGEFNLNLSKQIPKIIHQTAPRDPTTWNDTWTFCQKTWLRHFPTPEFEYWFWTDEDLYDLIATSYPQYLALYNSYEKNIERIDIARYLILHKYGGIYADMDYCCSENFYYKLPLNKVCLVESPYKSWEHLQNSLLASPPNDPFWIKLVDTSASYKKKGIKRVLLLTGPQLLDNVYATYDDKTNFYILPHKHYNPKMTLENLNSDHKIYTAHLITNTWVYGLKGNEGNNDIRYQWLQYFTKN